MARTKKEVKVVKKVSESEKIRQMDVATIEKTIEELKQELFNLRFQAAVGKLENTAQIKKNKKQIARMKTILTERANALK
jgi:large subunit ribosomal protein L29